MLMKRKKITHCVALWVLHSNRYNAAETQIIEKNEENSWRMTLQPLQPCKCQLTGVTRGSIIPSKLFSCRIYASDNQVAAVYLSLPASRWKSGFQEHCCMVFLKKNLFNYYKMILFWMKSVFFLFQEIIIIWILQWQHETKNVLFINWTNRTTWLPYEWSSN